MISESITHIPVGIIRDPEFSLFTYDDDTFYTLSNPSFEPEFEPTFSSSELEEEANSICGSDQFCLFDIAATNRTDIGLSTLIGNIELEMITNISQPGN